MTEWIKSSKDKGLEKDSDAIVEHFKAYGVKTRKSRAKSIREMRASVEKHFK